MDGWMNFISGFLCFSPFLNISVPHYLECTVVFFLYISYLQEAKIGPLNKILLFVV